MKHTSTTLKQARNLRRNMTTQERKLWQLLRNSSLGGFKFRRQVPIGNYVADFVCELKNIIIEIDGGQHNDKNVIEHDKNRTTYFNSLGYKVLRFWNTEIDKQIDDVCGVILEELSK